MSHFTVLVIGDNPEEKLAPFDESIEVERYIRETKDDIIKWKRKDLESLYKEYYSVYIKDPEKYRVKNNNDTHIQYYLDGQFIKEYESTDEELYQAYIKNKDKNDIAPCGGIYSTHNPKSKWDWYSLGGRWTGLLKLKQDKTGNLGTPGAFDNEPIYDVDSALKGDIDFETMQNDSIKELEETWDKVISGKGVYNSEYYLKRYKTKENYVRLSSLFSTFAVITEDGEWHEVGEMGWFGCSSETDEEDIMWQENYFNNFIKDLPDDTLLSIYDCHI